MPSLARFSNCFRGKGDRDGKIRGTFERLVLGSPVLWIVPYWVDPTSLIRRTSVFYRFF